MSRLRRRSVGGNPHQSAHRKGEEKTVKAELVPLAYDSLVHIIQLISYTMVIFSFLRFPSSPKK